VPFDLGQLFQDLTESIKTFSKEMKAVTNSQEKSEDSVNRLAILIKQLVEGQSNGSSQPSTNGKFLHQSNSPSWD